MWVPFPTCGHRVRQNFVGQMLPVSVSDVPNLPPSFARSVDWTLDDILIERGFELIIYFEPFGGDETNEQPPRFSLLFRDVASFACVELVYQLQYFPETECPPVIARIEHSGLAVHIDEFSIHSDAHGDAWLKYRVTLDSEVFEIITRVPPVITDITHSPTRRGGSASHR